MNNPFLSLLIILAIGLDSKEAGLGCVLGGVSATLAELMFKLHPWNLVENGVAPFNGALYGSVLPSLYHLLQSSGQTYTIWIAITIGSVLW